MGRERPSPFCFLRLAISLISICVLHGATAQSNLRCKRITGPQEVLLDSIPVDPNSITTSREVGYRYDEDKQVLVLEIEPEEELEVCYRVISPLLTSPFFIRDIANYDWTGADPLGGVNFNQEIPDVRNELFTTPGISKSGAITRGISVGNRQNVFINSSLNLVMEGQLNDDLSVSAVITDQNIPYQPDGNTQQLRDFDNVFIKLYNDDFDLTLGDVVLSNPVEDSYFLKFYKNVQGGTLSYRKGLSSGWRSESRLSASIAKGQFASISIDPIEGVQGPYRVRGPEGQRFIIVLANSERVFVDGRQLERGFERDYVIDYNLGEIIFNTNVVITRFTRIRVDFEFLEQSYARSNLALSQEFSHANHRAYFSFYRERDNPNNTATLDLDGNGRAALSVLDDGQSGAFVQSADSIGFVEERILYARRDTIVDGASFEVFIYSVDPSEAFYNVRFTELGPNQGNYNLATSTANGRVYAWTAPIDGIPQGRFEPVVEVTPPDQRQMFVVGSQSQLGKFKFNQEIGVSERDLNLLSPIDDEDNTGVSWRGEARVDSTFRIGNLYGSLFGSFEFNQRYFEPIDRFRYIEFDRDWVFAEDTTRADQTLTMLGWRLQGAALTHYQYQLENRNRGTYNGWRQTFDFSEQLGPIRLSGAYRLLDNDQENTEADWLQTRTDVRAMNNVIVPGYSFTSDQNVIRSIGTDSVLRSVMHFTESQFYLQNPDSTRWRYRFAYSKRNDQLPVEGNLEDFTEADNFNLTLGSSGSGQRAQVDFNYRIVDDKVNDMRTDQVQGRLLSVNGFWDNHVRSNMSLAISNGRELRQEFIYILVNTGEGTHTWRDENEDGIQDLNEFYEAINPDERQYIKLFVPTDEYITVFRNQYVHNVDVSMPRGWRQRAGILKLLSKLSYQVNLNLDNKTSNASLNKRINPYTAFQADDQIISRRNQARYSVFYNRVNPGFGVELSYNDRERRQLLTNGFEQTDEVSWFQSTRIGFLEMYVFTLSTTIGNLVNASDFLESRNFEVSTRDITPRVTWQQGTAWRVTGGYKLIVKENQAAEVSDENSSTNEWSLEVTHSRAIQGNINGRLTFSSIDFEGDENTFLGYTLLNGLRPGRNFQMNLNWQQRLANGLQLTMQYFGRKSGMDRFVHTGSFQLTAFF